MNRTLLSFGVTGHRNLASTDPELSALAASAMTQALADLAEGGIVEGTVVSALAEGADRLVAHVGLDRLGFSLVVPLPMPVDAYETDFSSCESKAEFHHLLARATAVVQAPLLSDGEAWRQRTEARNHQYGWGGAYLVAACDVLIAIWDGTPARGTGGTAHVVEWFLTGNLPSIYGLAPQRVATGRQGMVRRLIHIVPGSRDITIRDVVR